MAIPASHIELKMDDEAIADDHLYDMRVPIFSFGSFFSRELCLRSMNRTLSRYNKCLDSSETALVEHEEESSPYCYIALIGVANEGNSIRIILEELLEAANALKKQMWAEVQLDKRRMKEEYVMKMQYPSYISDKTEPNVQISSAEGRQSPLPTVDDKNGLVSTNPVEQKEHLHDAQNDQNYPIHMPTERNPPIQEASTCTDNLSLLQPGYAAERSRSQLKAYIGHKAEEMYVYRSLPLGQDRRRNRYWQFITSSSRNDPGSGRIFVKLRHGCWRLIDSEEGNSDIDQLGKIFAAFGTPKPSQWPDIKYLPDYVEYQYVPGQPLRQLFPMASDDALDLLSKMFTYDPKARISALQALEHRYFSSGPPPTEPALLPRPPPKKESLNSKVSDFNIHEGPTVLSPPRKSRRVMPNHEGFEGNEYQLDDAKEGRPAARERTEHVPMPLDFSVFGSRPPTRPTINSADRSHLKRKLDLEFQLPEEEDEE